MRRLGTRTAAAIAAATMLGTFGAAGISTAGAAAQAPRQPARASSLVTARPLAVPGARLWVARYNGPGAEHMDLGRNVAVSPDGARVFVTGTSEGASGFDYATVGYSAATGARLWVARYNGPAGHTEDVASLAVSPDGTKVFVTGTSESAKAETEHEGFFTDYATVAYNAATGAQLWARRYNGPAGLNDTASSVAASRDGTKVFVTGFSEAAGGRDQYSTVAYSAATGTRLWVRHYGSGQALAVASPGNGRVYVTGQSDLRYATVAYDAATGAQLWARRSVSGFASSLAASPDRAKVFVTGSSAGYFTVAYNAATGAQLWARRYLGPTGSDSANSLAVARDGAKVFVTGISWGGPSTRDAYATVAYNAATGTQLWARRYNPGSGGAQAYSVSAGNGTIYVTGASALAPESDVDYATVAYNAATGARQWIQRYNGPGDTHDVARSVAVNPAGTRVFVTGQSIGTTTDLDYATIAYRG